MLYAFMLLWLVAAMAMPTIGALMSQRVPPTAQGELQGANASIAGLAAVGGPLLFPMLYGAFSQPGAGVVLPGAPYVVAGLLAGTASLLLLRALRRSPAAAPATLASPALAAPAEVAPEPLVRN